jgi:hypothetical protein
MRSYPDSSDFVNGLGEVYGEMVAVSVGARMTASYI